MELLDPAYYLHIKWVHIMSSTLLFGTGLGTAFFMWRADVSGNVTVIASVSKSVVLADWIFTAPAVIIQPLSGYFLMQILGLGFDVAWVFYSVLLFLLIGCFWLPVVWLQWKVSQITRDCSELSSRYRSYMRAWYALGWPAFIAVLVIFYLMVVKPI